MFKILQLTDLHFGEILQESPQIDNVTKTLIKRLIKENNPDFIVITGDLIWSLSPNSLKTFQDVLSFINAFQIPFAITLGNHDSESDFSRSELNEIILAQSNFTKHEALFEDNGCLCYYVPLNIEGVNHRLYFIDSGDYDANKIGKYDYIKHQQIEWLIKADKDFNGVGQLFFHIPIPEYKDAKQLGLAQGNQDEEVCCPQLNTGLFSQLIVNNSSVKAMYCGHDHNNDFEADYHGIKLNYGRITGFNTYGTLRRGGRIIELNGEVIHSYIVE